VPPGGNLASSEADVIEAACLLVIDGTGRDRQHGEGRKHRKQGHEVKHGSLLKDPTTRPARPPMKMLPARS
jgi:hypothetical protein